MILSKGVVSMLIKTALAKQEHCAYLRCDCNCSMFEVHKTIWPDGDTDYNIMVTDSRYDHNHTTMWGRIKSAYKILLGKPVYYSDVYISGDTDPDKFKNFVDELVKLCSEGTLPKEVS